MTARSNIVRRLHAPPEPAPLFRPGGNCWRVAAAARGAVVVDGQAYFDDFAAAATRALAGA